MAVEKSYAPLGLFLVVAAGCGPRDGDVLPSPNEEPRSDRRGNVHERKRQRPGGFEPGSIQGRVAGPRLRRPRRSSLATASKSTSKYSWTAS